MVIEMPGGPQLDHYYGRGVEGINENQDGEAWEWEILLSGGVRIRNHDESLTSAPSSERFGGLSLLSAIMSEKETRLIFGISRPNPSPADRREELILTPTQYEISDPNVAGGPHFPQRPDELQDDETVFPGADEEAIEINDESDIVLGEDEENGN